MNTVPGRCIAALFVASLFGSAALLADETTDTAGEANQSFWNLVKPLLDSRCITCHGPENQDGGLRLDSRSHLLKGGETGPAVVPGKPQQSLLIAAVRHSHETLQMPPKEKLKDIEIAILERWIQDGASWPSRPHHSASKMVIESTTGDAVERGEVIGDAWTDPRNPIVRIFGGQRLDLWSLKPIARPELPEITRHDWPRQELDCFVLSRLERDGLTPPMSADPRSLARRIYYDLTGLPPTCDQVQAFASAVERDGSDTAIAGLVDVLLNSPRFGEHFARMWLDVVRYSDSNGFDWDEFRPQAWRFRDYVVRSFNSDKPFDHFLTEQLAGDELLEGAPATSEQQDYLIATGYLRMGPYDNAAGLFSEQDRSRAELLADLTETTATAFLGLTFGCCRCHDHKYDPFSQVDHYRLRAFFAATRFADDIPIDLANEQQAINEHNARVDEQAKPLRAQLAGLPQSEQAERDALTLKIDSLSSQRRSFTHGLLMSDNADNVDVIRVLFQGDHLSPRQSVEPGFLSLMDPLPSKLVTPRNPKTTGRRLTLARWIASAENPWTARVMVNRIWLSLLGKPLVATPNDFGLAGAIPQDEQLLDWLASEFVSEGWSVKRLVRTIATSATYRQVADYTSSHTALRTPRRLSAEQLRDSILMVSGLLTEKSSGPPIWPELPEEILVSNPAFLDDNETKTKGWYPSPKPDQYCRSLFLVQKRNTRVPLLEMFDLPDNSTSCARRQVSTVAPQALMLLNSPLAADAAKAMAQRVTEEAGEDPQQQLRRAFELAMQRAPNNIEHEACMRLLREHGLDDVCRVLLNVNEFVFVD